MQIAIAELAQIMNEKFIKAGLSAEDAATMTESMLDAERSGIQSHGLTRFPIYLKQLHEKIVEAQLAIKLERNGNTIHVDGGNNAGILVAQRAMKYCINIAKEQGICAASICHSNHFTIHG